MFRSRATTVAIEPVTPEMARTGPPGRQALLELAHALCDRGQFDAAEALFRDAPEEYRDHLDYAISFAQTAQLRCSFDEALERSQAIVRRFPEQVYGYATSVLLLAASGQVDAASDMLRSGLACFGDAPELLLPAVHLHVARQDWPAAAAAIEHLRDTHPDQHALDAKITGLHQLIRNAMARDLGEQAQQAEIREELAAARDLWKRQAEVYGRSRDNALALARCNRALGDLAGAHSVLLQATSDYADDVEIKAHLAETAEAADDWPQAAARWREILLMHPEHTGFGAPAAIALARSGATQEAEQVLARLIPHDPKSLDLRSAHAMVAQFGGDWQAAVQRWDVVNELAPGDLTKRNLRGEAIWHLSLGGERHEPEPDDPAPGTGETEPDLKEIFTQFESVGDNCEFGLVQRHFGAEPTTLFRFSALHPAELIMLLDLGLEPLGDPAHTVITSEGGEYVVKDDRGYYWMHSFLRIGQVDPARYLKQQHARITLLKRKFLSDLRAGGRIYVCKQSGTQISDDTLHAVSRSLSAYGDNMLLGVRVADDDHPSGTLDRIERNILVGYVTSLFGGSGSGGDAMDHPSWERVIRAAYEAIRPG